MTQRDAQHLTTLTKDGLDDTTEQGLVATQISNLVARHADNGTLHLGWGIKDGGLHSEQVLDVIPRLDQDGQDTILLVAWLRGHAQGDLVLDHSRTTGDEIFVVEHLEKDLRRDVVGIVACQYEWLTIEHLVEIHAEEISTYYIII